MITKKDIRDLAVQMLSLGFELSFADSPNGDVGFSRRCATPELFHKVEVGFAGRPRTAAYGTISVSLLWGDDPQGDLFGQGHRPAELGFHDRGETEGAVHESFEVSFGVVGGKARDVVFEAPNDVVHTCVVEGVGKGVYEQWADGTQLTQSWQLDVFTAADGAVLPH